MNRTFRCKLSILAAILGLVIIAESKAQSTETSGDGKQSSEAKNPDAEKAAQPTPENSSTPSPEGTPTPPSTKTTTPVTAGLPLHDAQIVALPWEAVGSMFNVPIYQRQTVKDQVESVIHSGQKVLECFYGDPAGEWKTYYFWYDSPPSNLQNLVQSLDAHPLRALGFRGLTKAPPNSEAARRALEEAQQELQ